MKVYKVEYGARYYFQTKDDPFAYQGEEIFILENEDDPINFIDKHYTYLSEDNSMYYERIGPPTLLLVRTKISDVKYVNNLTKGGEWLE